MPRRSRSSPRETAVGYEPMLATLTASVPDGDEWRHEVKWDGYRVVARIEGQRVALASRNGLDATGRFPGVAADLPHGLRAARAVVDGEVCAFDADGRPSFQRLQRGEGTILYYVFDLLELDGAPLVELTLGERRARLTELVDESSATVRLSRDFADGEALLAAAREQRLEGIMSKRLASRYLPGRRTTDWRKVKVRVEDVVAIAGYTPGEGARARFGSLVLAARQGPDLVHVGNCGTGFTEAEIDRLLAKLQPLERETTPLTRPSADPRLRRARVRWVEPRLRCRIEFAEWTNAGHVRSPAYKGLVPQRTAIAEVPSRDVGGDPPEPSPATSRRSPLVGNLDRVLFPADGITKGDLVAYYHAVAPVLLPHLRDRAFVLRRAPEGIERPFFFAKDVPPFAPDWLTRVRLPAESRQEHGGGTIEAPVVCDERSLLWLVGIGCIDLHVTLSRVDAIGQPDQLLFDLDPAPMTPFADVRAVALLVREALGALGLRACAKTSGQTGLHVVAPIARGPSYADVRGVARTVAEALERVHPQLATTQATVRERRGVLVDWRQNHVGASVATAYSVRPVPGAPVSCPLTWAEVEAGVEPAELTMGRVLERVAVHGDLFAEALAADQSLAAFVAPRR